MKFQRRKNPIRNVESSLNFRVRTVRFSSFFVSLQFDLEYSKNKNNK